MAKHDIHAEIARARQLFADHGEDLAADPAIARLIDELRAEIAASARLHQTSGFSDLCADCGGRRQVACCFPGAVRWLDHGQLLINLLLGCDLPDEGLADDDCLFNGPQGCRLVARGSICLNFFCPESFEKLGDETIAELRRQVGREVWAGRELEMALIRRLGL